MQHHIWTFTFSVALSTRIILGDLQADIISLNSKCESLITADQKFKREKNYCRLNSDIISSMCNTVVERCSTAKAEKMTACEELVSRAHGVMDVFNLEQQCQEYKEFIRLNMPTIKTTNGISKVVDELSDSRAGLLTLLSAEDASQGGCSLSHTVDILDNVLAKTRLHQAEWNQRAFFNSHAQFLLNRLWRTKMAINDRGQRCTELNDISKKLQSLES